MPSVVLPQLTYPATAPEQQQGAASSSNAQAVTRLCEQLTTVKLESEEAFILLDIYLDIILVVQEWGEGRGGQF